MMWQEQGGKAGDVAIGKLPAAKRRFGRQPGGVAHFYHSLEGFICVLCEQYFVLFLLF